MKLDIRASDVAKNWIQESGPKDTGGPNLDKNRIQLWRRFEIYRDPLLKYIDILKLFWGAQQED